MNAWYSKGDESFLLFLCFATTINVAIQKWWDGGGNVVFFTLMFLNVVRFYSLQGFVVFGVLWFYMVFMDSMVLEVLRILYSWKILDSTTFGVVGILSSCGF
jgi:hypothetical protein